jgi:hypothetical protein
MSKILLKSCLDFLKKNFDLDNECITKKFQ